MSFNPHYPAPGQYGSPQGYPPAQQNGYPAQQQGKPPAAPGQQVPGGYPPQQQNGGYPQQPQFNGQPTNGHPQAAAYPPSHSGSQTPVGQAPAPQGPPNGNGYPQPPQGAAQQPPQMPQMPQMPQQAQRPGPPVPGPQNFNSPMMPNVPPMNQPMPPQNNAGPYQQQQPQEAQRQGPPQPGPMTQPNQPQQFPQGGPGPNQPPNAGPVQQRPMQQQQFPTVPGVPGGPGGPQPPQNFPGAGPPPQFGAPPAFPTIPGMQPQGPGPQPGFNPQMPGAGFAGAPPGMPPGPQGGFMPGPGGPGAQGPPGNFPVVPGMTQQGQGGFPGAPGMGGFPPGPGGPPGMPGMPGMPGGYNQQQAAKKVDANMMPSAVVVMADDEVRSGLFPTGYPAAETPPLTSTNFFARDEGNCNPRLMRSTLYSAPANNDMLKSTQIPFAVGVTPFAKLHPNEAAPPVIDLGPAGPVRCARCKAYMCPFMEFQDGGRKFKCPFCLASSQVEEAYFAHLDHTGRRTDIDHRPELYCGAYEFVATKQYCKNGVPPKEPAYLFMIDVSYNSISSGVCKLLCDNLEKILQHLPRETGQSESSIRVGLATFDQAVHFYDLSSVKSNMMIVGDVNEMFVPIVDGLLLPYTQALPAIRSVLQEIPNLFSQNKTVETILGPVITAGMDAIQSADRAGKLMVFTTSLPKFEAPGKLKERNERQLLGTDKEKNAITPQGDFYTKAGEQCVKAGVTVDLFLFPNQCMDVATISQLSAVTGGSVYKYQYFTVEKDAGRFLSDLQQNVSRQVGFDCMVKVRSSAGIRPVNFSGSFFVDKATDLEFSSIDEDKTFFAELKHDDKLTEPQAVIQTAILYTSITGQRRLRILNLCLATTNDYNQMYRTADQDTLVVYLMRIAVGIHREKSNKEMKEHLAMRCAQILATYREKCSEQAPAGQLILPETLKLLPLYVNSIIKNDAVSGGSEMTVDDKVWMIELLRGLKITDTLRILYPRVYPVGELELQEGADVFKLPPPVRASYDNLRTENAYLIDNGIVLFLRIGMGIPHDWVKDIFGVESLTQVDSENHIIPEKDNSRSRALRKAIQSLEPAARKRKLFIIREQDGLEGWMRKFLNEDKHGPNDMSYVDYVCHIHREIRNILN